MKNTIICAIVLVTTCFRVAHAEPLNSEDLARAFGMQWWTIDIPESDAKKTTVRFEIEYSDGKTLQSGSMTLPAVRSVKAFCWVDADGALRVAAVWATGSMRTSFNSNPFSKAKVETTPVNIGESTMSGMILKKGSSTGSVSSNQELESGSFGLKLIAENK